MIRSRSRNLGDEEIADIAAILDGWRGKLSWNGLVETVASRTGQQYTRQALHRHERIRLAFTVRKRVLSGQTEEEPKEAESPELRIALDRIARLGEIGASSFISGTETCCSRNTATRLVNLHG